MSYGGQDGCISMLIPLQAAAQGVCVRTKKFGRELNFAIIFYPYGFKILLYICIYLQDNPWKSLGQVMANDISRIYKAHVMLQLKPVALMIE